MQNPLLSQLQELVRSGHCMIRFCYFAVTILSSSVLGPLPSPFSF